MCKAKNEILSPHNCLCWKFAENCNLSALAGFMTRKPLWIVEEMRSFQCSFFVQTLSLAAFESWLFKCYQRTQFFVVDCHLVLILGTKRSRY